MSKILITGGTGLLGTALTQMLVKSGHSVTILSRSAKKSDRPGIGYAQWNVQAQTIDRQAVAEADYIVHLAGANVAGKRWTSSRKKEIIESRTKSSALLMLALKILLIK